LAEPSFEKALDKLEKIVEELEDGELTLDETIKKFEEGVKLSRLCEKKLSAAQKKVSLLTKDEKGNLKEMPFAPEDDEEGAERERTGAEDAETESLFDE
jgi:exodeoxyribonuclease VII small subunit